MRSFKDARSQGALAAWYRGNTWGCSSNQSKPTGLLYVWGVWRADGLVCVPCGQCPISKGSGPSPFMINYRVRNLDAMLAQLRAAGAPVDERVEDYDFGRFGWATDPEGNRFELWEPRPPGQGGSRTALNQRLKLTAAASFRLYFWCVVAARRTPTSLTGAASAYFGASSLSLDAPYVTQKPIAYFGASSLSLDAPYVSRSAVQLSVVAADGCAPVPGSAPRKRNPTP